MDLNSSQGESRWIQVEFFWAVTPCNASQPTRIRLEKSPPWKPKNSMDLSFTGTDFRGIPSLSLSFIPPPPIYEGVSKRFRTESITKYTLTTIHTRWEAAQSVMAAKLIRLTHKIAIQLHLVAESSTICSSRSRRPVRKLLNTSCSVKYSPYWNMFQITFLGCNKV
jgi:hypothetical protein